MLSQSSLVLSFVLCFLRGFIEKDEICDSYANKYFSVAAVLQSEVTSSEIVKESDRNVEQDYKYLLTPTKSVQVTSNV